MSAKALRMVNAGDLWTPMGYDMHIHLREDTLLDAVLPFSSDSYFGGLVMPNTKKKILTGEDALEYRGRIYSRRPEFHALMTIYLTTKTTPKMVREAKATGVVWAGKWYPAGVTTGSDEGFENFEEITPTIEEMEKVDMVLSIHGQLPGKNIDSFDREEKFLPTLEKLHKTFPKLRIVMEHLSTKAAVETVLKLGDNVAATITIQHMLCTRNDFMDGALYPDNFCIPPFQRAEDREALILAAISGDPKFFFGSDSAPHLSPKLKGGVFSAPVAKEATLQLFEERNALNAYVGFAILSGPQFYRLPTGWEKSEIHMIKTPWTVPKSYPCGNSGVIVPLLADKTVQWQKA